MKLIKARVTNFRSVEDSNEFEIGDLTCLVGKNEAGKTAVLNALYGLNPLGAFKYDKVRDYPRRYLTRFDERHPDGESSVVETHWRLSSEDVVHVEKIFGKSALKSDVITIRNGFQPQPRWSVQINEAAIVKSLASMHLSEDESKEVTAKTVSELNELLSGQPSRSPGQQSLVDVIGKYRNKSVLHAVIDALAPRQPKMFYTSHFERMSGEISIQKMAQDKQQDTISVGDQIFLDFLEYAGTSLEDLEDTGRLEELKAKCQAASNDISDEIFEFWSQNEALAVEIDLAQGRAQDSPPFNTGTVGKVRIFNQNHKVSVPLSERSAGFLWFFSFLSQFKQMRKKAPGSVMLLDEPGLTLHGKAQADLLRYIVERLLPDHQVIYSTHSPFMVPADRLQDVRVVEDVVRKDDRNRPVVKGTKVSSDVLTVDKDTLFPLQAHLGYEITQSLFIGANTLLVEGPSDILYLQAASNALKRLGREGLSPKWTLCPSGGIDKIAPFASLFGSRGINIAVLCDFGAGDKAKIQRLRSSEILKSEGVFTAADFTSKDESDVEDFFDPALFAEMVNLAYGLKGGHAITGNALTEGGALVRQVKQVESIFKVLPEPIPEFDHFTPAAWLIRNAELLERKDAAVLGTLDKFEAAFNAINRLVPE